MIDFYVAKSYQDLEVVEQPYTKEGGDRLYCKVKTKKGAIKEVRAYNEKEYNRMYPAEARCTTAQGESAGYIVRKILGFDEGYIIIFTGAGPHEDFFEKSNARYHRMWGWYIPSTETVPVLPQGVSAICLPWERVGDAEGRLYPEEDVLNAVRKVRMGR